jgi:hypothetical protein
MLLAALFAVCTFDIEHKGRRRGIWRNPHTFGRLLPSDICVHFIEMRPKQQIEQGA